MNKTVAAAIITLATVVPAMAQPTTAPAPGPAQILSTPPSGKTIGNYYKQSVYDPSNAKIGSVDDVVVNNSGQVTALIIGVGGFLGAGEKDVAVKFDSVSASMKNGDWYLTVNTTKDALKAAPGVTFDKTKTAWVPASS